MAQGSEEPYEYTVFDDATQERRLFHLLPELAQLPNGESVPRATLTHGKLEASTAYIALSYTWGDPDDTKPIQVNGRRKNVTKNVHAFLLQIAEVFRENDGDKLPFWIDAVCINQGDKAEKSRQVQVMAKIFSLSKKMILWLGPASKDSHQALEFLSTSARVANAIQEVLQHGLASVESKQVTRDWLTSIDERYDETLGPLLSFVLRPWWTRAWIQQEVALAPMNERIILRGNIQMPWENLIWGHFALLHAAFPANVDPRFLELFVNPSCFARNAEVIEKINERMLQMCRNSYHAVRGGGKATTPTLAERFMLNAVAKEGRVEAGLPVDLIYSILAICADATDAANFIRADYSKKTTDVFIDAAGYLYMKNGLRVLGFCASSSLNRLDVPSWVPDWTARWPTYPMSWEHWDGRSLSPRITPYCASGPRYGFSCTISKNGLQAMGVRVDVVKESGIYDEVFRSIKDSEPLSWLAAFDNFLNARRIQNVDSTESTWRIPIADRDLTESGFESRASVSMQNAYIDLMERMPFEGIVELRDHERRYVQVMNTFANQRQPYISRKGFLGLGPILMEAEDQIFIIFGHSVPVVLREGGNGTKRFVGETYVDGIMYGEYSVQLVDIKQLQII